MLDKEQDFSMRISMLASGSSGNMSFLETPKVKILIDAGLNGRQAEDQLKKIGQDLNNIDAIFVTHEHSDHVKGLGVLARRYGMDIYANKETWEGIDEKCGKIDPDQKHVLDPGDILTLGDLDIVSFTVSHDSRHNQGYVFSSNNKQFGYLTDLGYVPDRLVDALKNFDCYLMESNYDTDMLRMGPYAWPLKQRILSDHGHLSNEDSAEAMARMVGDRTRRIYLGHLSETNNMKEIALETYDSVLKSHGLGVGYDFDVYVTDHDEPTELFTL